jgi:hypothetical protein
MTEIVAFTSEDGVDILVEASDGDPGMRDIARGDVVHRSGEKFESVLGRVRSISTLVARELREVAAGPDEVSVELGVKVNAEANVLLAKTAGESAIKVTMTWYRDPSAAERGRSRPVSGGDGEDGTGPSGES